MYSNIIILIISICIICCFSLFYKSKIKKKEKELIEINKENFKKEKEKLYNKKIQAFENTLKEKQEEIKKSYREEEKKLYELYNIQRDKILKDIKNLENKEEDLKKQKELLENIISLKEKEIDKELDNYKKIETLKIENQISQQLDKANQDIDNKIKIKKEQLEKEFLEEKDKYNNEKEKIKNQCEQIKKELDDYYKKQKAINEAIIRQRTIENNQDFYRIKLKENDKQDIKYLLSIIDNIKNPSLLYKLIWSEYIQKPFNSMLKETLQGKENKCVIYKITNINTKEIYIGKTRADVSKRWTEHIKTSLNIGSAAKSKIHNALFNHWDEFTFEILEKVSDDSLLSQREKYYINFYESNIYGYNMNSGG